MHVAAGQTLVLTVTPDEVHRARRTLARWLMDAGIAELSACDIVLGAAEAAAEAIAHAASRITVTAAIEESAVVLTIADDGHWRDPGTGLATLRGHALTMVEAASAHFEITHADDRTTLTARFRLETA